MIFRRILQFYIDGFKSMTVGKYLWIIIFIKLFIMFFILKLFFFKSELSNFTTQEEKENHVKEQLINRATN